MHIVYWRGMTSFCSLLICGPVQAWSGESENKTIMIRESIDPVENINPVVKQLNHLFLVAVYSYWLEYGKIKGQISVK